jgi:hypothetical protein
MRRALAVLALFFVFGFAWAAWHTFSHATLHVDIHDYALATSRQLYDSPRGVRLELLDAGGKVLAHARTVEPHNYVTVVHPDPAIADCTQFDSMAVADRQAAYAACFEKLSKWISEWATSVRTARFASETCSIASVPAKVVSSIDELWLWWVPLPHVGGTPYRRVSMEFFVDTRTCAPAANKRASCVDWLETA